MNESDYKEITKKCIESGMIKIHFTLKQKKGPAGESVWAYQIGETLAKIANIPVFAPDVSSHDIVEFEQNDSFIKEFVRIVEKNTNKFFIRYQTGDSSDDETTLSNFNELRDFVSNKSWHIEGTVPGFCMIAAPISVNTMIFEREFFDAPHVLEFYDEYEE